MDAPAIALRFATYAILSLVAGVPLFLRLALGPRRAGEVFARYRAAYGVLLAGGALLTQMSLLVVSAGMAGTPVLPVDWEMVALVLSATASGKAILIRAVLLLLLLPFFGKAGPGPVAMVAAIAAATLAWGGHAAASEGMAGCLHMLADIVHILAAAIWIGGMACLLLSLRQASGDMTLALLRAFALLGGLCVALLIVTGIFNSVMILGVAALPGALGTLYGQLLALKLLAFAAMLALAANNRFRLTPAFERHAAASRARMAGAVAVEIALGFLILMLVGWLGMIDPTAPA